MGWVGWAGTRGRGTEGRPGTIPSPSVQTRVCAVGPRYLPRQRQQPALPPGPTPPTPAPCPLVTPPLESPSRPPPRPHPQNSHVCHVRTVTANTLGHMPGGRKLSQEAGALASLRALLFAQPRPQGAGRELLCFGAQWHEGSVRMNGQGRQRCLLGGT